MKFKVVELRDHSITLHDEGGENHVLPIDYHHVRIFDDIDLVEWIERQDFDAVQPTKKWWENILEYYNFERGCIGLYDDNRELIYSDSKVEYSLPNVKVVETRVEPATDLPGDVWYRVDGDHSWRLWWRDRCPGSLRVVKSHVHEGE